MIATILGVTPTDLLGSSVTSEWMIAQMTERYKNNIICALEKLNVVGLEKAAERVAEFTELSRYTNK